MSKSHNHAIEPASDAPVPALADLDAVYCLVTRAGVPVVVRPPFPADHQFTDEDRQAINAAWFRAGLSDVGSDLTSDGTAANYSDDEKAAYAHARLNGGGTVAGKTVEKFSWSTDGVPLTLLEEAIDRVRWDHLCFGGAFEGAYDSHKTQAELKDRAKARAAIRAAMESDPGTRPGPMNKREGFGGGMTYAELVQAKAAEVQAARYAPKTRAKKEKSAELGI